MLVDQSPMYTSTHKKKHLHVEMMHTTMKDHDHSRIQPT